MKVHLVSVTTADGESQLWLAATPREDAVGRVREAIPQGWTASLVERPVSEALAAVLDMKPGQVCKIRVS